MIVRYFARCFLRCPRCHHFDAASVVRCRFFASCRKHFAHFAISDEILRPHRVCNLCEGFFAGEISFPSSKERRCLQSPFSRCVLKSIEYLCFASAHIQKNQTPEMTHAIFSESECFRRKIMTQSNRFKLTKTKPPSAKTEVFLSGFD